MNATYNIADDKLRLYCGKVDRETFDRLRAAGFQRAPKQECFYTSWTPGRENLLLEYCDEIEDDDITPAERAADRAQRMATIAANASSRSDAAFTRADSIASQIPFGQPILVGHHSEHHARRDADRIHNAMSAGVEEHRKAGYYRTPDPISYRTRQPLYPSGTVLFWGNFLSHAGVFRLSSDDPDIIARLTAAIRNHQQSERYQGQWFCRMHRSGYHFLHGSWRDPQGNLLTHEQESRLQRPAALPLTTVTAPTFPTHPAAQLPLF